MGIKAMKLTDVGQDVVSNYIDNDDWVMQQKLDGARMITVIEPGKDILFSNDGVVPIKFAAAKLKLPAIEAVLQDWVADSGLTHVTLDGELIIETGTYWVFDVLYAKMADGTVLSRPEQTWEWRHAMLHELTLDLVSTEENGVIKLSPTAYSTAEKEALWRQVVSTGVEGAVSKRRESSYVPGARSIDWVKHKLVKTVDAVVTAAAREIDDKGIVRKGSVTVSVYVNDPSTGGETVLMNIGAASLIGKDLSITVGSVVELEYLYWTGKSIIQPRITRRRLDKEPAECDLDQLPEYTRKIAWRGER